MALTFILLSLLTLAWLVANVCVLALGGNREIRFGLYSATAFTGLMLGAMAVLSPAIGWDSLSHWLFYAERMIVNKSVLIDGYFHHPRTYSAAIALAYDIAVFPWLEIVITVMVPATFISSLALLFSGATVPKGGRFLLYLVALTMPLLENHYLIFGYADLPVAIIFFSALVYSSKWRESKNVTHLVCGI